MTLVAAWKEYEKAVLIGDLLVTGPSDSPDRFLPTTDDVSAAVRLPADWGVDDQRDWKVTATTQKLYMLSDSIVVGCLGSGLTAKIFVREAMEHFCAERSAFDDVKSFLATRSGLDKPPCTIIGWLAEEAGTIGFRWNSAQGDVIETGERFVDGSGAPYLNEIFEADAQAKHSDPVKSALAKVTTLLAHEVRKGTNLFGRFGGGYQIAVQRDSGFLFSPSVTFIFLRGVINGTNTEYSTEQRMLKSFRENDVEHTLAIIKGPNFPGGIEQRLFSVSPLGMHASSVVFPSNENVAFQSDYYCIDVQIQRSDSIAANCTFVVSDEEKDGRLRIVSVGNKGQEIELHSNVFKQADQIVRDLIDQKKPVRERFYLT